MTLVAIMRPADRLQQSAALAKGMGFEVVCASPIDMEVRDSPDFGRFLVALQSGKADMVMFSSSAAVHSSLGLARRRGGLEVLIQGLRKTYVVAIGPVTMSRLAREGVVAEGMPEDYSSDGLVAYAKSRGLAGKECYVLRSDHGVDGLLPGLRAVGLLPHEVAVYSIHRQGQTIEMQELIRSGERGEIDVFLFTSSLCARTLIESWADRVGLDATVKALNSKRIAAIGPPTKEALESYGARVDIMPGHATFEDLLKAVKASIR